MERLAWAKNSGCPWVARTFAIAALGEHLEVLQWARDHGCPWDARTCEAAARGGYLEVSRWAREHLCPWGWITCHHAARAGTWKCGSGLGRTAARGTGQSVHFLAPGDAGMDAGAAIRRMPHGTHGTIRTRRRNMTRWIGARGGHQEVERRAPEHRITKYSLVPRPRYAVRNTNGFLLRMGREDVLLCRYARAATAKYAGMDTAVAAAAVAVAVAVAKEEQEVVSTMPAAQSKDGKHIGGE